MPIYEPNITAILCVDLYNDFLSEGGKLFPWIKDIAEEVGAIDNLRKVVAAAREAGIHDLSRASPPDGARLLSRLEIPRAVPTACEREPGLRERLLGWHLSPGLPGAARRCCLH